MFSGLSRMSMAMGAMAGFSLPYHRFETPMRFPKEEKLKSWDGSFETRSKIRDASRPGSFRSAEARSKSSSRIEKAKAGRRANVRRMMALKHH